MNGLPPRFVVFVLFIASMGLVLAGTLTAYIVNDKANESDDDCARTVAARNDSRTMWLYLLEANAGSNPKAEATFREQLNELLPALKCESDGDWVPVEKGE